MLLLVRVDFVFDFPSVLRPDAIEINEGEFRFDFERGDVDHAVRIEAVGYRTKLLGPWKMGDRVPRLDVELERAAPIEGVAIDADGQTLQNTRVWLGTFSEHLNLQGIESDRDERNRFATTDEQGRFTFPAEFEPYFLCVRSDSGYAQIFCEPDQQPGELRLEPWARVEGRLLEQRKPAARQRVSIQPNWPRYHPLPRVSYYLSTTTSVGGKFLFEKVPPFQCRLRPRSYSSDNVPRLRSSQSVPLDLQPGQVVNVKLGGNGVVVNGRLVVNGLDDRNVDLTDSRCYLLRKAEGIGMPKHLGLDGQFDWQDGWIEPMDHSDQARAFLNSLHHYTVQLTEDGQFTVSGVPAGDYQFVIRLHETQGFVDHVVKSVRKFSVTADDIANRKLNLADLVVDARQQLPVGTQVPDFKSMTINGHEFHLNNSNGRFTLMHFWYTENDASVSALPELRKLHEDFGGEGGKIQIVGVAFDRLKETARAKLEKHKLPWSQVVAGHPSETQLASKFRVTRVPTYFLISPKGALLYTGADIQEATDQARDAIKR